MIHDEAFARDVARLARTLACHGSDDVPRAQALWHELVEHERVVRSVCRAAPRERVPLWRSRLVPASITGLEEPTYTVLGVDGSQIYPDPHTGVACYALRVGGVILAYAEQSSATYVHASYAYAGMPPDWHVDHERAAHEYTWAVDQCRQRAFTLVLFDGCLYSVGEADYHTRTRSIAALAELRENGVLYASYVSAPQSFACLACLVCAAEAGCIDATIEDIPRVADADVMDGWLSVGQRTPCMYRANPLYQTLPREDRPCFFSLRTQTEVARIEVPSWIARDEVAVNRVACMVYDQTCKGGGYPAALSQAHDHVVVTHADRKAFYTILYRHMQTTPPSRSSKAASKHSGPM